MNWEDLRYVLALSRAGTLTSAADELGVARTTVGRRIEALEQVLGVRLFDQTPSGFVATPAGADLAATAEKIETDVLAAEGRVLGRDAELHGELRVATLDFLFQGYVGVFASFAERYPGVEMTVCASYDNVSLRRREADVALRLGPSPGDHLVGRSLGEIEFGLYAHRRLVEELGDEIDLNALPFLRPDTRTEDDVAKEWMSEHAPRARTAMRFDVYPTLRSAVRAGIGAYLMACIDGDDDPNLVRLGAEFANSRMKVWVLTLPELMSNNRVRVFMDHMHEQLRPLL